MKRITAFLVLALVGCVAAGHASGSVKSSAGRVVPRRVSEKVPAGVREIDIRSAHLSVRVTGRLKVRTIIRWFDALRTVQDTKPIYCPALLNGRRVTFDFRSARQVLLAHAWLLSTPISTVCNPVQFSIRGHKQRPLIGLDFWNRVKRLVRPASR